MGIAFNKVAVQTESNIRRTVLTHLTCVFFLKIENFLQKYTDTLSFRGEKHRPANQPLHDDAWGKGRLHKDECKRKIPF